MYMVAAQVKSRFANLAAITLRNHYLTIANGARREPILHDASQFFRRFPPSHHTFLHLLTEGETAAPGCRTGKCVRRGLE
jgi:hypothetical protein